MKYIDWEEIWAGFFLLTATLLVGTLVYAICQPHNVDYYYLSQTSEGRICAYAHWTWHVDERAGCFNTPQEAVDFVTRTNQAIKH